MKLYIKLISLTVALGFIFVVGYLSGLLLNTTADWWFSLAGEIALLPNEKVFRTVWLGVYLLIVTLLTPAISERKLRAALPLWLTVGALNVGWVAAFFRFRLLLLALAILLTEIALLSVITDFYIRNTRFLWCAMLPVLGWYLFSLILHLDALI